MSLIAHSTPAERNRGCSWADRFESQASVENYGATVNGAPTFDPAEGVTLDGSSDDLSYALTGSEVSAPALSFVVEFTPDFEATEDYNRYIFDTDPSGSTRTYVLKLGAASNYAINVMIFGASFNIPLSTYGGAWLTSARNVLIVSATSGNNSVWLNGTKILDGAVGAWTGEGRPILIVGARYTGVSRFKGTFHRLQVFKCQLEDQEALDFCNGTVYDYLDDAIIFPMTIAHHGGTVVRDASDTYSMTINGDPIKLSNRGYALDGTADCFYRASDGSFRPSGDFSFFVLATPGQVSASKGVIGKWGGAGDRSWELYQVSKKWYFYVSPDGTNNAYAQTGDVAAIGQMQCVSGSYDLSTTTARLYVDDLPPVTNGSVSGPAYNSDSPFAIGAFAAGSIPFIGTIYYAAYIPGRALTRLQHLDLRGRVLRSLNEV